MDRTEKRRRKREAKDAKAARRGERKPSVILQEIWNLPNMLTMARIAVIPLFVWLTYDADPLASLLAAVVFTLAAVTDVIDGMLARRMNLITVVGKFLDPLADKLIVMAALVMMVRLGRIWASLVIVLIARELIVSGLRAIAASEGLVIAAGQEGKWKTSLQLTAIIALCVHYVHPLNLIWVTYPIDYNLVGKVLLSVSAIFSVWSAIVYFRGFFEVLGKRAAGAGSSGS